MDITLSDVLWILGSLAVFVAVVFLVQALPNIAQFAHAVVNRYFTIRYDMSSAGEWGDDEPDVAGVAATTATTQQQSIAMQQSDSNALLLHAKAEALAQLVKAGAIGETKGLQIVFSVRPSSTNPRYLAARDALKAEMARLEGGAQFVQPDGSIGPATYPVTGQPPLRTRVR